MLKELIEVATNKCKDRLASNLAMQAVGGRMSANFVERTPSHEELIFRDALRSECRIVTPELLTLLRESVINVPNLTVQCCIVFYLKDLKATVSLSEIITHGKDDPFGDWTRGVALVCLAEIDKNEARRVARQLLKGKVPGKPSKELRYCANRLLHPCLGWLLWPFVQ
jgi:hypothetical protein